MNKIAKLALVAMMAVCSVGCSQNDDIHTIHIADVDGEDMTLAIRNAFEEAAKYPRVKLSFDEGTYRLTPDLAYEQYTPITNHGNGSKRIAMLFEDHKSVEIEGNGAKLLFHGQMFPFLFERCDEVKVSGLTIDWDTPFTFLGEVKGVSPKRDWIDVTPRKAKDGFSWRLQRGKIMFPNIDGFNYPYLGSTLAFEPKTKRPIVGAVDLFFTNQRIKRLPNGDLRIYERINHDIPVGSLLSSKGDREHDRYAPALDFKESSNITLDGVTIHHALGMAFLFERSENITIKNSNVMLSKGSKRVISSTADASHFANCKGDILIENCRFQNMLDDGTNVHGTYVVVSKVLDEYTVLADLQHFEQLGFKFTDAGDELWTINAPSPKRANVVKVKSATALNEKVFKITFEEPIADLVKDGDLLENKTWNPTFTMRGCTIQNHRARSIVLKTPLKTVIENNHFSSMMSGVLFRGESKFWYESGAVEDVLIKGNTFDNAADCGTKHAMLYITPLLGKTFDATECYDCNIRFVENKINGFNSRLVIADRVDGLVVKDNIIVRNDDSETINSKTPMYELINCVNCRIENNQYSGLPLGRNSELKADEVSYKTLLFMGNIYNK